jgi:hypothetical protein
VFLGGESAFSYFSFTTIYRCFCLVPKVRCYYVASQSSRVAKPIGSITVRKRKDGSIAYTAQIRIMQKGVTVYQESQTFDRKTMVQAWLKRRETEMAEPGAITKANRKGVTVKEMIKRYFDEYEKLRPLGKTKSATLKAISEIWLCKLEDKRHQSEAGRVCQWPNAERRHSAADRG